MKKAFSFLRSKTAARRSSASVAPATERSSVGETASLNNPIRRDSLYYNTPLMILVEGILFKVARSYLEKSKVFRETYLLGPQGEEVSDGLTDQRPLRLDGVDANEFRYLLRAMIRDRDLDDISWTDWISVLKLSQMWKMELIHDLALEKIQFQIHNSDQWIAVLKISTRLRIQGLRQHAIKSLHWNLSSLKMIELAIECGIQPWLMQGYLEFVMSTDDISAQDAEQLGLRRTSDLLRIRRRHQGDMSLDSRRFYIRRTFASEFAEIAAFDTSPISSYLSPDLHPATDPDDIRRVELYYHVDIIFLVEDTLFTAPRYLFEENSEVFRDMFLLPCPEGISCDGSSDEQPLFLEGVRKVDFRWLLKAMKCPAKFQTPRHSQSKSDKSNNLLGINSSVEPMPCAMWISVLELSSMWQMDNIRETALKKILEYDDMHWPITDEDQKNLLRVSTKLGLTGIRDMAIKHLSRTLSWKPAERVQLGIEWQVNGWLPEAYNQLVKHGMSVVDKKRLGRETTTRLLRLRDEYLRTKYMYYSTGYCSLASNIAVHKIEAEFAEELKGAVWVGT